MSDSTKKEIKDILKYFDTKFLFFGSQKTQNYYRKFLKKSLSSIATQSAEEERTRILEALPKECDEKNWKWVSAGVLNYERGKNNCLDQVKDIIKKQ